MLGDISFDLFAVPLSGAPGRLPLFARGVLRVGPEGFGALRAAPAVGALVEAGCLVARPVRSRVGVKTFVAVRLMAVFAFSRSVPLSALALAALRRG